MSADIMARGLAAKARSQAVAAQATGNAAQSAANTAQSTANAALAGAAAKTTNTQALIAAIRNNACFPQPALRTPANNIPVVTIGLASASSTINARAFGNPLIVQTDSRLKWLAGPTIADGSGSWFARGGYYGGYRASPYAAVEFTHTGSDLEICVLGSFSQASNNLRILVDDRIAAVITVAWNTGAFYYVRLVFPTSAARRIRAEGASGKFRGVNVANAAEVTATGRPYPLISVMGDSFDESTGANNLYEGEAITMARALGCNMNIAAVGGTGVINPATGGKVAWTDTNRLTDLTLSGVTDALGGATSPALGIIHMSINDQGLGSTFWGGAPSFQQAISNGVWTLIDAWIAANVGKPLVFFGPTWTNSSPPLDVFRIRDATQEACWGAALSNIWFIDRMAPTSILRSGVYTNTADQASLYTVGGADPTHPNQAGHNLDGLWMASQLRRLITSEFT
jgi:hypothetical protein